MQATNISSPGEPISWRIDATGTTKTAPKTVVYTQDWTAPAGADASAGTYSGTTRIKVDASAEPADDSANFEVAVAPSPFTLTVPAPVTQPFPCLTDPCCASTPLFPVTPPWADASPFNPGQAADLNVILLAVIYVMFAGATTDIAEYQKLYQQVALLVNPNATPTSDVLNQDAQAVKQMLADLCCSLLYPGPTCQGEPHGVVIGCATINGREIERLDPWSGRRWVMHYPLWSYWGAQFGLVPPDVLASRVFSFICCVAGLKLPNVTPTGGG